MKQTSTGFGRNRGKSFSLSSLNVGFIRDFSRALHRSLILPMTILVTGSIILGVRGKTVGDFASAARVDSFNWTSLFSSVFDQSDHPQLRIYEDSRIVQPRGGNSTLEQHVLGDTRSDYTSWTLDLNVAKDFAGADGIVLSVNESQILNITYNTYDWSPFQLELEVTILGPVEGAIPIK